MFSSRFSSFDEDPFFIGHTQRMRALQDFGMPMLSLNDDGSNNRRAANDAARPRGELQRPQDMLDGMFGQMQRMMGEMSQGLRQMDMSKASADGNCYVQSSVYSYRDTGSEEGPEIYEVHRSNRYGPEGVREERKALRDTKRHLEKMAVGRHIKDRGHVLQKSRNTKTNEILEHQNLIGLQEDELEDYKREWHQKTKDWTSSSRSVGNTRHTKNPNEIRGPKSHKKSTQRALEYQHPDTDHERRPRRARH